MKLIDRLYKFRSETYADWEIGLFDILGDEKNVKFG